MIEGRLVGRSSMSMAMAVGEPSGIERLRWGGGDEIAPGAEPRRSKTVAWAAFRSCGLKLALYG